MALLQLAQLLPTPIGGIRPPDSQKSNLRPISFLLVDQSSASGGISQDKSVTLYIRPEELTVSTASRLSVQQTLGDKGSWADSFGKGLSTINISGHTGWRRDQDAKDGQQRFVDLQRNVINNWHDGRDKAINSGRNPDEVQLILVDALDRFAYVVAPLSFTLRRSKSRPLLSMFNISLVKLNDNIDQLAIVEAQANAISNQVNPLNALKSFAASVKEIATFAKGIKQYTDKVIAATAGEYLRQTHSIYQSVQDTIGAGAGIETSILNGARMTSQAGYNVFRSAAAVAGIPALHRARLMEISGAFTNIFCLLQNAIAQQPIYQDFSPIFGASNCSSTSGGRPPSTLTDVNPFYLVNPIETGGKLRLTANAQESLRVLASNDIVLSPLTQTQIAGYLQQVLAGMTINV